MAGSPAPPLPRYGTRSLAELVPSLLTSLGLAGLANPLALEPAPRVCLLLVDGLGWELLEANRPVAPFLNAMAGEPLSAGFPATTAASLSSLATGLPPGEHGLVGYTMALPGYDRAFNALTWSLYGLEAITEMAIRLLGAPHAFVYAYHPRLDTAGHVSGVRSQAWRDELTVVDRAVRLLAEQLPPATLLVVTGDHGMVDLRPSERLDLADHPELASGVRLLAGEARARYVRTVAGATADVLTTWRSVIGDRMWIWGREEAIATGIFGPRVTDRARERIGDVVAAAYGRVGIVQRDVDPAQARLNGHHGSLTVAEQLVPFLVYRS